MSPPDTHYSPPSQQHSIHTYAQAQYLQKQNHHLTHQYTQTLSISAQGIGLESKLVNLAPRSKDRPPTPFPVDVHSAETDAEEEDEADDTQGSRCGRKYSDDT